MKNVLGRSPFGRRFGSIFREMEEEMADMERRMNRVLEEARDRPDNQGKRPLVYGWTLNVGPEGEPEFRRFGNVDEFSEETEEEWREPFVTSVVDDEKDVVRITAELPGVNKEHIDVETFEDGVRLEAVGEDRQYRTGVPVDVELAPETAEARFNNGILELTVGLSNDEEREGHKVDVR